MEAAEKSSEKEKLTYEERKSVRNKADQKSETENNRGILLYTGETEQSRVSNKHTENIFGYENSGQ